jgi:hypothetical protein
VSHRIRGCRGPSQRPGPRHRAVAVAVACFETADPGIRPYKIRISPQLQHGLLFYLRCQCRRTGRRKLL